MKTQSSRTDAEHEMKLLRPCSQRAAAFTLLELLATIMVVAISLLSIISSLSHGIVTMRHNNLDLLAKTACRRQMERMRNLPFTDIATLIPSSPFTEGLEAIPGATGRIYVCDYNPNTTPPTCDTTAPFGDTNILRVTVTVSVYTTLAQDPLLPFGSVAYAGGGGGGGGCFDCSCLDCTGGGGGAPPALPRSVWRLITLVSRDSLNR